MHLRTSTASIVPTTRPTSINPPPSSSIGPTTSTATSSIAPNALSPSAEPAGNVLTTSRVEQIQTRRKRAQEALANQAERMVKRSRVEHAPGNPGNNVKC